MRGQKTWKKWSPEDDDLVREHYADRKALRQRPGIPLGR